MKSLLTDPDRFFADESTDPDLLFPSIIVVAAGLLGALSQLPMLEYVDQSLTGTAAGASSLIYVSTLVGAVVGPIVIWLIVTAFFYGVATMAFDGEGSFVDTLGLVGWGYVPAVLSGLLSVFGYYWVFSTRPPESISDPRMVQTFLQDLQGIPEIRALIAVGILFTLWQGVIWAYAIKQGLDVSLREGAITAALPVVATVLFSLNSLL
ncbi:Yip1 family protein [Halomicrobium salinisoli]|uniref:Yip1 family protein n=1 Tax=Halomicrobium salinisoli TaxID=2878391 RepID=UPI001CF01E90|nr:YIP1 family protein [Halomicrobium salinisoli]